MSATKQELITSLIREDFAAYSLFIHNYGKKFGEDNLSWVAGKVHTFLCNTVQTFVETETDNPYDILLISMPPQHGKSLTITETFPSWYLMKNQEKRVIEISYNDSFCKKFGKANKSKVLLAGHLFGTGLSKESTSNVSWRLSNDKGSMDSRGVKAGITGLPADLMIIDDPIKNREEADSATTRESLWNEWETTFSSRLQNKSKVIIIQTRWHEDDLYGRLKDSPFATCVNLPCEAEENDILGREIGEPLAPEIGKDEKWLFGFKNGLLSGKIEIDGGGGGQRTWNALFQGRPSALEGNLLKREHWRFYTTGDFKFEHVIMSVDATFKDKENSDFVAIEIWGKAGNKLCLIELVNEHLSFTNTVNRIITLKAQYPDVSAVLIEDKANGSAIIDVLSKRIMGIIGVEPKGGKVARVNSVSDLLEAHNLYLPRDRTFTGEFIDQCADFPNATHDDMVDAFSMAVERLRYRMSGPLRLGKKKQFPSFNLEEKPKFGTGRGDKIVVL